MRFVFAYIFLLFVLGSCSKPTISYRSSETNYHYLEDGEFRLHYISKGNVNNPPLLLIHGAPGTLKDYNNLLVDKALQENYNVIAVDRLGYGLSKRQKHRTLWSIDKQAEGIIKALDSNRSGKEAVIIGRSYGAPIAAKIAALYPSKVRKVIMVSPVIDPSKEKIFWFAYAAKHWLVKQFLNEDVNLATDEKFAHKRELRKLEEDWENIQAEVTVFQGGEDWIADVGNLDYAKRKLGSKKAKYIFLPSAGHMITETHKELVKKEVLN
ncbi:Pimeloyl-ACP methyl ester carboxylesterase [Spirosomataceae bacterium TFI 002]|nr:Pimeloyl-ACP methyl ester carboxylesterase [Spirosomataceae bacterium TFI 002]